MNTGDYAQAHPAFLDVNQDCDKKGMKPQTGNPYGDFVECLPALLLYIIGMKVGAANNFAAGGLPIHDNLDEFGEVSRLLAARVIFLQSLHGQRHMNQLLRSLSSTAGSGASKTK
jgi:hypothetical protein